MRRPVPVAVLVAAALLGVTPGRATAPPAKPKPNGTELPKPDPALRELIGFRVRYRDMLKRQVVLVRQVTVTYTAWDGATRSAVLGLPKWYGPRRHPPIPLVISPHGRGGTAEGNARLWGGLPAFGPFAVVNPEGQGRRLKAYSWGWRGQIDDLARMPGTLEAALPWFRVDRTRIYAIGSSMAGRRRCCSRPSIRSCSRRRHRWTRRPTCRPVPGIRADTGRARSPAARANRDRDAGDGPDGLRAPEDPLRARARFRRVQLDIWWSRNDKIVVDQNNEAGRPYRAIKHANPRSRVEQFVGTWAHSHEMHPLARLPLALVDLQQRLVELDMFTKTVKP